MTLSVKHKKVAATPDDGTSEVGTNEWNDEHALTMAAAGFLGAAAAGDVGELTPDQARVLLGLIGVSNVARAIYAKIVAWYDMDETSGTTMVDAHVNGLNGTYSGVTLNQAGLASGLGASVSFGTNAAYAEVADTALLRPSKSMACMVWVKRNGAQANFAKLLWKPANVQSNGNANYLLQQDNFSNGGKLMFRATGLNSGGNADALSSAALADATVYQLIGNHANDQLQVWRNGAMEGTNQLVGDAYTVGGYAFRLGSSGSSDGFVGSYGQAAIFGDLLTPVEIAYLYNSGNGVSYTKLKTDAGYNSPAVAAPDAAGVQVGYAYTESSTPDSTTGIFPLDATIPQNTEGGAYAAVNTTYTPKYANSLLEVEIAVSYLSCSGVSHVGVGIFRDSQADALAVGWPCVVSAEVGYQAFVRAIVSAGSTSPTTFKMRYGVQQSGFTARLLNLGSGAVNYMGSAAKVTMTVREIKQ